MQRRSVEAMNAWIRIFGCSGPLRNPGIPSAISVIEIETPITLLPIVMVRRCLIVVTVIVIVIVVIRGLAIVIDRSITPGRGLDRGLACGRGLAVGRGQSGSSLAGGRLAADLGPGCNYQCKV